MTELDSEVKGQTCHMFCDPRLMCWDAVGSFSSMSHPQMAMGQTSDVVMTTRSILVTCVWRGDVCDLGWKQGNDVLKRSPLMFTQEINRRI